MTWTDLLSTLNSNSSFLITSHASLDGDSVGSQLAMYWYLRSLGKQVSIYNADPMPPKLAFLRNADVVESSKPSGTFDVLVVLDCSNLSRIGWSGGESIGRTIVNIDHHTDNSRFGNLNFVQSRSATGEILYEFLTDSGIEYPDFVAEALYAAIVTDTGGFRFSNTTPSVLRICGNLAERGANPSKVYEMVYASQSQKGMILHSRVWSTLGFHLDGRVCTMELPLGLIDELGATYSDSEGMADLTIMVSGVDVGVFIKHREKQSHFSLRSRDSVDVGRIARMIPGGGGHCNAAGCTIEEPIDQALPQMLALIKRELD
jgi:bifunctional oligoribonuclease and PAP phosphatase NrnA